MVEAKGYWLSVQAQKDNNPESKAQLHSKGHLNYIVRIHHQDTPAIGMASEFKAALQAFKDKLAEIHSNDPKGLPQFEHFDDVIEQEEKDIAMVFVSEYEIMDALKKAAVN